MSPFATRTLAALLGPAETASRALQDSVLQQKDALTLLPSLSLAAPRRRALRRPFQQGEHHLPESMRQLLRQILRAHRTKLPPNMRSLGDQYVRKEFADMRDVTKPDVLERFRGEWEKYLQQLEAAPADDLGADLDAEILGTMSDDQKAKLVDMRASSRKLREEDGK